MNRRWFADCSPVFVDTIVLCVHIVINLIVELYQFELAICNFDVKFINLLGELICSFVAKCFT
jgi:hypothetical protein